MSLLLKQLNETASFLRDAGFTGASTGIVLGTGLGELVNQIKVDKVLAYSEIPNFPISTVEFHKGNLIYGSIGNQQIIAMQGRFHYYEGYTMQQITFPIRLMKMLGLKQLLLSNAAGAMNLDLKKEDLAIIEDHINLQTENPLRGLNSNEFGPRFPDMSRPYDGSLNDQLKLAAKQLDIEVKRGVYVAVDGPSLETRAEYKYLRAAGADMVGMSTVPEVIVANQVGLPCAAVSVITDECDPENLQPVNISEIIATAGRADKKLSDLFGRMIGGLV